MIMDSNSWKKVGMGKANMLCLNLDNSSPVESEDSIFGLDVLTYRRSSINANYERRMTKT